LSPQHQLQGAWFITAARLQQFHFDVQPSNPQSNDFRTVADNIHHDIVDAIYHPATRAQCPTKHSRWAPRTATAGCVAAAELYVEHSTAMGTTCSCRGVSRETSGRGKPFIERSNRAGAASWHLCASDQVQQAAATHHEALVLKVTTNS